MNMDLKNTLKLSIISNYLFHDYVLIQFTSEITQGIGQVQIKVKDLVHI